jgi:tetrahydromethanopterin S-methyltransferase subunit E
MAGQVMVRAWSPPGEIGLGGGFEVLTAPPLRHFHRRFWRGNSGEPFTQAIGFASTSAAALGWDLIDETGQIAPALCAALVAEQAGKGGATVTPITYAMDRRAERAAGGETSTLAPGGD